MCAACAACQQQSGKAHRVDNVVRTRLPRQQFVIGGAHHHADRYLWCKMAHGQHDKNGGIVPPGRDKHGLRFLDTDGFEIFVSRSIGFDHVAAKRLCRFEPFLILIHYHDAGRIGAAFDKFAHGFGTGDAEAQNHDMIG